MPEKNEFLKLPKTKTLLWALCCILVVLVAFGTGIVVGYRRAIFTSEFGARYYRDMYGDPFVQPMVSVMSHGPLMMHGIAGQVVDVSSGTLLVKDMNGNEASVLIMSGTPIREMDSNIPEEEIQPNDRIIVIGQPDPNGQIDAHFIRVFEATSTNF